MLRTRVGYAGGTTPAPTYRAIGDHSEALQVDFDPAVISYEDLLAVFFASHNACRAPFSRQYRSAILVMDEAQLVAAERAARAHEGERDARLATAIEAFGGFTLAEDYHQKYRLRRDDALMAELERWFPTLEAFVDSPTVTRLNAFAAGYGDEALRARDLPRMGLSPAAVAKLR